MGLFPEVFFTAVCTVGLGFLAYWLFGLLLRPAPGTGLLAVLPGRGAGEGLEQRVRALVWLRGLGLLRCPIVIADVDLTPAGRELALHLALRWPEVALWPLCDLSDYISRS